MKILLFSQIKPLQLKVEIGDELPSVIISMNLLSRQGISILSYVAEVSKPVQSEYASNKLRFCIKYPFEWKL